MSKFAKTAIVIGFAATLSACDRTPYESTPVKVKSESGTVTCQLYTAERVMWDESIAHPESMTKSDADNICQAKGLELQAQARSAK
ncbi:hypothetical protein Q4544_03670 [Cognatishimia sp. 1_MG-2023]|uniref:hypothetical protein n=1 Tax=Cognatishimia sp. 1_MG-2023 TaxID=3062642 RepID=UPI0026E44A36|nr:hypothetical protein [Cognatishimia sp. 1_MG-2023]MDO6726023.1 hypothetical protein [Cognatishimia sp. 1_MG-2023]